MLVKKFSNMSYTQKHNCMSVGTAVYVMLQSTHDYSYYIIVTKHTIECTDLIKKYIFLIGHKPSPYQLFTHICTEEMYLEGAGS